MTQPAPIHHRAVFPDLATLPAGSEIELGIDEARHLARVRRARAGQRVELIDTLGTRARGPIRSIGGSKSRPVVTIGIDETETVGPPTPTIEICAALPKGDRLDRMIDQLTQIGVAGFTPLVCDRSERDHTALRPDRLERIVLEGCKQCGRAWKMEIREPIAFSGALDSDSKIVVCDASGDGSIAGARGPTRVLIGPEGGWSDEERALFHGEQNITVCALGAHVLRIETAAPVAAALALAPVE